MPKKQKDILVKDKQKIDRPKRYKVVLYNDDYTPMQLVTSILMDVFNKGTQRSQKQKSEQQRCWLVRMARLFTARQNQNKSMGCS